MLPLIIELRSALQRDGVVTFRVKVRPGASSNRFRGPLGHDTFKVDIAAAPEGGEANAMLTQFLADEFEVSRHSVSILSGETARLKVIRIQMS